MNVWWLFHSVEAWYACSSACIVNETVTRGREHAYTYASQCSMEMYITASARKSSPSRCGSAAWTRLASLKPSSARTDFTMFTGKHVVAPLRQRYGDRGEVVVRRIDGDAAVDSRHHQESNAESPCATARSPSAAAAVHAAGERQRGDQQHEVVRVSIMVNLPWRRGADGMEATLIMRSMKTFDLRPVRFLLLEEVDRLAYCPAAASGSHTPRRYPAAPSPLCASAALTMAASERPVPRPWSGLVVVVHGWVVVSPSRRCAGWWRSLPVRTARRVPAARDAFTGASELDPDSVTSRRRRRRPSRCK